MIMKAFTDINQSKKLAGILPIESADMHYSKDFDGSWFVDLTEYTSVKIPKYVVNIEEHLLPCWSLAALLSVLPEGIIENYYVPNLQKEDGKYSIAYGNEELLCVASNPVDACYEMILKLNELNLL